MISYGTLKCEKDLGNTSLSTDQATETETLSKLFLLQA